jgi:hypothetical protein
VEIPPHTLRHHRSGGQSPTTVKRCIGLGFLIMLFYNSIESNFGGVKMEVDLELQAKDLFKEVIWDGNVEQIAIWLDGDWSVTSTTHFDERNKANSPVYVINLRDVFAKVDFSFDTIEELINKIENMLNGRDPIDV